MSISALVGTIGLVLDIIGVIMLFNIKIKGIGITAKPEHFQMMLGEQTSLKKLYEAIEKTNADNAKAHDESIKWLWFIIVGFIFQVAALYIPTTPINHTGQETSHNTCCECHHSLPKTRIN